MGKYPNISNYGDMANYLMCHILYSYHMLSHITHNYYHTKHILHYLSPMAMDSLIHKNHYIKQQRMNNLYSYLLSLRIEHIDYHKHHTHLLHHSRYECLLDSYFHNHQYRNKNHPHMTSKLSHQNTLSMEIYSQHTAQGTEWYLGSSRGGSLLSMCQYYLSD